MWLCDVAASSSFLVGCMQETASLLWSVAVSHCWQQMMLLHPCVTKGMRMSLPGGQRAQFKWSQGRLCSLCHCCGQR